MELEGEKGFARPEASAGPLLESALRFSSIELEPALGCQKERCISNCWNVNRKP